MIEDSTVPANRANAEMARIIAERPLPTPAALLTELEKIAGRRNDVEFWRVGVLTYNTSDGQKNYDFVKIVSKNIQCGDRILLLRAGIHGDEVAGPLTLMQHLDEIIEYAHSRGLKVVLFPLDNPSGFEYRLRYNAEGDRGVELRIGGERLHCGNNDFIRYELPDGTIVSEVDENQEFIAWYRNDDAKLRERGLSIQPAKETAMLMRALDLVPLNQVIVHIDLHQDYISCETDCTFATPAAYHYAFFFDGNRQKYDHIVAAIEEHLPILRNSLIGGGQAFPLQSDESGAIVRHDGSLADYLCRVAPLEHCVTAETTGATPLEFAVKANMIWIKNIIDLAAA